MQYRLRLARWFADETKQKRLADILSDQVLAEALDIVAADHREAYVDLRGTASDAFLARREVESGATAVLIRALAALSTPPPQPIPHLEEWGHITDPEPSTAPPTP